MISDLSDAVDPVYLDGLGDVALELVREKRAECADLENGVSFVRRVAQGRLDVLDAEVKSRAEGAGGDLTSVVDSLATTLSESVMASGSGRIDVNVEPPAQIVQELTAVLDQRVPASVVSAVAELSDEDLMVSVAGLKQFEEELSSSRRSLHDTIDALNQELARRIVDGDSVSI